MERCKYCGEVLEYGAQFCHACGKTTKKEPSKRFLKKKAKEENKKRMGTVSIKEYVKRRIRRP